MLGGVSLNLVTKSQLLSIEGISEDDARKIMGMHGSARELSYNTLLAETALTEELILQWTKDKIIMANFTDFDLEADITEPLPLAYLGQTIAQLSQEMKQLTNRFAGLELRQEQLSSSLKNAGAMADHGLQMASNLVDSRE